MAPSALGACQRSASINQQLVSIAAVRGVLILVDHVLVEGLGIQTIRMLVHPGAHEGGKVQPRIAIKHRLIVADLVGRLREH